MACTGRYAEAWQFAGFWCVGCVISSTHEGAGPADVALQDNRINFLNAGVEKGKGMVAYNLTAGTNGPITDVSTHTVTAMGVTWDNGDSFRIVTVDALEVGTIENYLDVAAADIHQALAQVGACDCALASWATEYLAKINIVEAAMYHICPCAEPRLTDDQRSMMFEWVTQEINKIATLQVDLCEGATGPQWPAIADVDLAVTEFVIERLAMEEFD